MRFLILKKPYTLKYVLTAFLRIFFKELLGNYIWKKVTCALYPNLDSKAIILCFFLKFEIFAPN